MASWDEKLFTAAARGNIKEVELCVKNRANLECRETNGMTPLMWAVRGGHLEVVTFLVSHGSQLEATDTLYGMTPSMFAAEGGHLEVVTFLVSHGSQLEATNRWGMTPLMLAARGGHLEVVTFLVTHGSQLEATSQTGRTALHHAAEFGRIDVTKLLTDKGCSPWVKTKQGETPYDLVTTSSDCPEEKKKEVMDFLKKKRDGLDPLKRLIPLQMFAPVLSQESDVQ